MKESKPPEGDPCRAKNGSSTFFFFFAGFIDCAGLLDARAVYNISRGRLNEFLKEEAGA